MKFLIVIALVVCSVSAIEYTLENCKCGHDYQAEKGANGKVQCVGKLLDHIKDCNIPDAPRCICKKDQVNGIMSDKEGTWCTFSEKGVVKNKWQCENTAEWDAYKIELENYEKTL